MTTLLEHLEQRFQLPGFRPGQEEIVRHIVSGSDALIVMPTGAGKSLCYQLPALARGGTGVVISPLIALMKDQVEGLQQRGIRATFINSSLTTAQRQERMAELRRGHWELIYVAPERFTKRFVEELRQCSVSLLALDEAHCLSQWGHDFRPDYLRLGRVRRQLGEPCTVALTATATPMVQQDIVSTLGIPDCRRFVRGFQRDNLYLSVVPARGLRQKSAELIKAVRGQTSIVYASTRRSVEQITTLLREQGLSAGMYHGGLSHEEREQVQDAFMSGAIPLVVATNAFGMGVDKEDVRRIVHWNFPGTVEAYYQEIGRAGRDGLPSEAVLLFQESDRRVHEFFIGLNQPPIDAIRAVYLQLLKEGQELIPLDPEKLAQALPGEKGAARVAQGCIKVLEREGWLRRFSPRDQPGYVTLLPSEGRAPPQGVRALVYKELLDRAGSSGQASFAIWPRSLAMMLDLERSQLSAALSGLSSRDFLSYQPPPQGSSVLLLRPDRPLQLDRERIQERRQFDLQKLDSIEDYAQGGCRWRSLLAYFGEQALKEGCQRCDACARGEGRGGVAPVDSRQREIIRVALSCLARMGDRRPLGQIVTVLTGSTNPTILRWGFHQLSTFGLLSRWSSREVRSLLQALVRAGALARFPVTRRIKGRDTSYAELGLTPLGIEVMRNPEQPFEMHFPASTPREWGRARSDAWKPSEPARRASVSPRESALLEALQQARQEMARARDVPAYSVAVNRSLEEMSRRRPQTREELEAIYGMGSRRVGLYGEQFLKLIRDWKL